MRAVMECVHDKGNVSLKSSTLRFFDETYVIVILRRTNRRNPPLDLLEARLLKLSLILTRR